MRKLYKKIEDYFPCKIFYTSSFKFFPYDKPFMDGIEVSCGRFEETRIYTNLGLWFRKKPLIFEILKLPYYLITFPIYYIVYVLLLIIYLLFSSREDD